MSDPRDPLDFLLHRDITSSLENEESLLTVAEAAYRLDVSEGTVRGWIRRGQVVAVPDRRGWLVGEQSAIDCEYERRRAARGRPRRSDS